MISGIRPSDMASTNRQRALQHLRRAGALSRRELARRMELTPASITKIADQLCALGAITETDNVGPVRAQARTTLALNPDFGRVISIAMQYELSIGVIDFSGKPLERVTLGGHEIRHGGYRDEFPELLLDGLQKMLDKWGGPELLGIGVASGGFVKRNGIIVTYDALPEDNVDIEAIIRPLTDLPVTVEEENRLLLLSRLWNDATPYGEAIVVLNPGLLGAGGGQALAVNGQLYYGRNGMAGLAGEKLGAPDIDIPTLKRMSADIDAYGELHTFIMAVYNDEAAASELFHTVVKNHGYRLAQIATMLSPDEVLLYSPYKELGDGFLNAVWDAAKEFADPQSLEGLQLRYGGRRSAREHLIAAAVPLFAQVV